MCNASRSHISKSGIRMKSFLDLHSYKRYFDESLLYLGGGALATVFMFEGIRRLFPPLVVPLLI